MKAYLILEDGTVFTGTSIGSPREVISERSEERRVGKEC